MARYHQWGFIVNEAGEPIENTEITVKLAGTEELACVYYDEFGVSNSSTTPGLSAGPQLSTLSNGYYEFWIGDIYEPFGYRNDQKFKLEWIRIGVASGEIDYINVFPLGPQTDPVALTDCVSPSIIKNKLISDYLACKWDAHSDMEVVENDEFYSVHGLDFVHVDQYGHVDEMDTVPNKIINNYLGWHWDKHRLSTVQEFDISAGRPHNMEEVNPLEGDSTLRNKLVSNRDLYYLHSRITDLNVYVNNADIVLQNQINDLNDLSDLSKSGLWTIYSEDWIQGLNNQWFFDIVHNLDIIYPSVFCWDIDSGMAIQTAEISYINTNTIKIVIDNENYPDLPSNSINVRISNGGIHRYP